MEEALRALLTGYAPLTALVSTRIYWNEIPQAATDPAVVLYKITGAEGYTMQGTDGLDSSQVQIDVRALTVISAWAVSRAIKTKLAGFRDASFGGVFLLSERQSSEKPATTLYHRVSMDFAVNYAA